MNYNVFGGTLSLAQADVPCRAMSVVSIPHHVRHSQIYQRTCSIVFFYCYYDSPRTIAVATFLFYCFVLFVCEQRDYLESCRFILLTFLK